MSVRPQRIGSAKTVSTACSPAACRARAMICPAFAAGSATVTRGTATAIRANPCRYSEPKPPAARPVPLPEFKATPARIGAVGAVAVRCGP